MIADAPCVLIVDDNPVNRALVEAVLTRDDWRLASAATGEQALEDSSRLRPAVVVLDYRMPGMNGADVVRRLRAELAAEGPAVLLVTAMPEAEARAAAVAAGADDWLSKPFAPAMLREKVRRLVAARGAC